MLRIYKDNYSEFLKEKARQRSKSIDVKMSGYDASQNRCQIPCYNIEEDSLNMTKTKIGIRDEELKIKKSSNIPKDLANKRIKSVFDFKMRPSKDQEINPTINDTFKSTIREEISFHSHFHELIQNYNMPNDWLLFNAGLKIYRQNIPLEFYIILAKTKHKGTYGELAETVIQIDKKARQLNVEFGIELCEKYLNACKSEQMTVDQFFEKFHMTTKQSISGISNEINIQPRARPRARTWAKSRVSCFSCCRKNESD